MYEDEFPLLPGITPHEYVSERAGLMAGQLTKPAGIWTLDDRIAWLKSLDRAVAKSKDTILNTLAREKGCSEHNALLSEYVPVRMLLGYYAKNAKRILKDENRSAPLSLNFGNKKVVIRKEPLGVVGIISPFNFPFSLPLAPAAAALVAGNAVVLKPSAATPETNALLEELFCTTLAPFGSEQLFFMLPAHTTYGERLVNCQKVDKIHFTGSVAAGQHILEANAKVRMEPPTLELGGSNGALVLEDADIASTAADIAFARFSGLNCNSIKRVFAVGEVFDRLSAALAEAVDALENHEIIQKVPEREAKNYERFLSDGKFPSGTKIVYSRLPGPVKPVLCFMNRYEASLAMLSEETFCPVLPVIRVNSEEEAVRYANDSKFGLGATVYTGSKERFRRLSVCLDAGVVSHNSALTEFAQPQVPFGGFKDSGWGFTHGPEGLLDFTRKKTVIEEKFSAPKLHHYPWTAAKQKWLRKFIDFIVRLS